ncbi:hypothetical protein Q4Q35_00970 [Flavivirga aquimarina]|uniref:Beta-lactamase-inhibitor-like PepSY-like domain-containing protein n=1 Tax=Flavivirga aquimarina TaxID=2027862 RepID=A0ABT8W5L6_9FLAO|nr:CAP-associated domain-containing protein [Flavivirga aquimarina]MDO5968367.1 hypothetical protein [Flavivirga aquimarina]
MKNKIILNLVFLAILFSCKKVTAQKYFVNDFDISSEFNQSEILSKIGYPDSVTEGGAQIVQEFGYNTYTYKYGLSYIDFKDESHAITNIVIKDMKLSINDIKIGASKSEVKNKFTNYEEIDGRLVIRFQDYAILSFVFNANGLVSKILYLVHT